MRRRQFLAGGATLAASLMFRQGRAEGRQQQDVQWLGEVNVPPMKAIPVARPLHPLLGDADGKTISSWAEWEKYRPRLRQQWLDFLGPMPAQRPDAKLEILNQSLVRNPGSKAGQIERQLVRYQSEPGEFVEGYLLRPVADSGAGQGPAAGPPRRYPAIVALHQTSRQSIDEIAEVETQRRDHQNLATLLCQQGFVVFCPRCYLWQTPPDYNIDVKSTVVRFKERHPKTLGMHKMLYDAQRAVDILVSLPEVDAQRIGAVGHSLGAKEVLYLAAFDDRIRTGIASEGGIAFGSTNWHDPWYLGAGIQTADFPLNHHQLLGLIAPRPFLVVGGEKGPGAADGDRSWPYLAAAQQVYRLRGEPVRLGLLNHQQGHTIPRDIWAKMLEWLQVYC